CEALAAPFFQEFVQLVAGIPRLFSQLRHALARCVQLGGGPISVPRPLTRSIQLVTQSRDPQLSFFGGAVGGLGSFAGVLDVRAPRGFLTADRLFNRRASRGCTFGRGCLGDLGGRRSRSLGIHILASERGDSSLGRGLLGARRRDAQGYKQSDEVT